MSSGAWVDFSKLEREPEVEIPPDVRRRMDARRLMPEPAHAEQLFFEVPICNDTNADIWLMNPYEMVAMNRVCFRKVRMRSEGGAIYLAWQCLEDDTVYI